MSDKHALVEIAQKIIVESEDNQVLILHDIKGKWDVPGGRLNNGESWEQGLARELQEETGIKDFTLKSVMGVENWVNQDINRATYGVFFHVKTPVKAIDLCDDHNDFRWIVNEEQVSKLPFFSEKMRNLIKGILTK